jgi:hypothetical protein
VTDSYVLMKLWWPIYIKWGLYGLAKMKQDECLSDTLLYTQSNRLNSCLVLSFLVLESACMSESGKECLYYGPSCVTSFIYCSCQKMCDINFINLEHCINIKHHQSCYMLTDVYSDKTVSCACIFEWHKTGFLCTPVHFACTRTRVWHAHTFCNNSYSPLILHTC